MADRPDPIADAAEALDDLLTQFGINPGERQTEDVACAETEMGEDIKTIIARAAVEAYQESRENLSRDGWNPPDMVAAVRLRPGRGKTWTSVTVVHDQVIGGGPYQSTTNSYLVAFDGGRPSSMDGNEGPFGVPRGSDSWANSQEIHLGRIKDRVKRALHGNGWGSDRTAGEHAEFGVSELIRFELIEESAFRSIWRADIQQPYLD